MRSLRSKSGWDALIGLTVGVLAGVGVTVVPAPSLSPSHSPRDLAQYLDWVVTAPSLTESTTLETLESLARAAFSANEAHAQDSPTEFINVRGSLRQGFSRVVFEWTGRFEYGVDASRNQVTVLFSRPSDANVSALVSSLEDYIAEVRISNDRLAYTIFLKKPARVNTFTNGSLMVVDLIDLEPNQEQPPYSAGTLSVNDWRRVSGQVGTQAVSEILIDDPAVIFRRGVDIETFTPGVVALPDRDTPQTSQVDEQTSVSDYLSPIPPQEIPPILSSFTFPFTNPVGAAVFQRGPYTWVVFGQYNNIDLNLLLQQSRLAVISGEQMNVSDLTVLRLRLEPGFSPLMRRGNNNTDWVMDFVRMEQRPVRNIEISVDLGNVALGPQVIFSLPQPDRSVVVEDELIGDSINVMLTLEPGIGVRGLRYYPEFTILSSTQGAAVLLSKPTSVVSTALDAYVISDAAGLHVSGISPARPRVDPQEERRYAARTIFDFARWAGNNNLSYGDRETFLLLAASALPPEDRMLARLELVRFYAAHARGYDMLGLLNSMLIGSDPNTPNPITLSAEYIALQGLANFLVYRDDVARSYFFDTRLDDIQEVILWRAMLDAREGQWGAAELAFRQAETIWREYPDELLAVSGLLRLETALALRDIEFSASLLPLFERINLSPRQRNALRYHLGRIALSRGNIETAASEWSAVASQRGYDPFNSARAEYALVSLNRRQLNMSDDEVLRRLLSLRYRWRGDRFELNVLNQLSQIYLQRAEYRNALQAMRQAVTSFPNDPLSLTLSERMSRTFFDLFFEGKADEMSPLRALALYDEFRELTPPTEQGNRMMERLVNRLVDVDLLEQAANLLSYQVDYRLDGVEKARVGMKLAIIHLIDGTPQKAVEALNASAYVQIPRDLDDDRRRVRAKAEYELGNIREATMLIAGDLSSDADLLRQDIFWEQRNWIEVSKVMQRLAGSPPTDGTPVSDQTARTVLYWVVALKLQGNKIDLDGVVRSFGSSMRQSRYASVFSFVVEDPAPVTEDTDMRNYVGDVANKGRFDAFLDSYRNRLRDSI